MQEVVLGVEWRGQEWLQAIQEYDVGIQVSCSHAERDQGLFKAHYIHCSTVGCVCVCVCV